LLRTRASEGPRANRARRLKIESLEQRTLLAVLFVDDVAPGGTGTLEDPFSSIQEGIDAAAAMEGEDTVMIAPGTYTENLTIDDADPLTLQGDDGAIVTDDDGEDTVIDIKSGNVTIEDLHVTGGKKGIEAEADSLTLIDVDVTENGSHGFAGEEIGQLTIVRGNYSSNGKDGINVEAIETLSLTDVKAERNVDEGLSGEAVDTLTVVGGKYSDNGDTGKARGIDLEDVGDVTLAHIAAKNNAADGVRIEGAASLTVVGGNVSNNGHRMLDDGEPKPQDGLDLKVIDAIHLQNVTVRGNGDEGLEVDESGDVRVIGGNFSLNGGDGLDLDNSTSISVRNVMSQRNGKHGLQVAAETQNVESVSIVRSVFSHNGEDGIQIVEIEPEEGEEQATIGDVSLYLVAGVMNGDNGLEVIMADTSGVTTKKVIFLCNGGDDIVGI
jgi:hypothetical protein